jgi:hypothetical protein
MYDLTTAVMNELDQELVRRSEARKRRAAARKLELEQAASTGCKAIAAGFSAKTCQVNLFFGDWCDCCRASWLLANALD